MGEGGIESDVDSDIENEMGIYWRRALLRFSSGSQLSGYQVSNPSKAKIWQRKIPT